MLDFMSMGQYTVYVWTAVGIVCAVISVFTWRAHRRFNQVRKALKWSQSHVQS